MCESFHLRHGNGERYGKDKLSLVVKFVQSANKIQWSVSKEKSREWQIHCKWKWIQHEKIRAAFLKTQHRLAEWSQLSLLWTRIYGKPYVIYKQVSCSSFQISWYIAEWAKLHLKLHINPQSASSVVAFSAVHKLLISKIPCKKIFLILRKKSFSFKLFSNEWHQMQKVWKITTKAKQNNCKVNMFYELCDANLIVLTSTKEEEKIKTSWSNGKVTLFLNWNCLSRVQAS